MRTLRLPILSLVLCALLTVLLSACSSRPTDFYMLAADTEPLSAATMPETTLALGGIMIPAYLDRPSVVVLAGEGTGLTVPRFNVWAEPLQQGLRRVMASMLAKPLYEEGVTVLPRGADRGDTDFALHMEIVRLDADANGNVVLEARWTLVNREDKRVAGRGSFAASDKIDMPAFGSSAMFNSVVEAESRLVQTYAKELSAELKRIVRKERARGTARTGRDR